MSDYQIKTEGVVLRKAAYLYDLLSPFMGLGLERKVNAYCVEKLNISGGEQILDVGCATGNLTLKVAQSLQSGQATGVDASPEMIKLACRKRGRLPVDFIRADAEELPFSSNSFQKTVSSYFFHHINIRAKRKVLAELIRVTEKGGRVLLADLSIPYSLWGKLVMYTAEKFFCQPEIGENRKGILKKMILESDFILEEEITIGGYVAIYILKNNKK